MRPPSEPPRPFRPAGPGAAAAQVAAAGALNLALWLLLAGAAPLALAAAEPAARATPSPAKVKAKAKPKTAAGPATKAAPAADTTATAPTYEGRDAMRRFAAEVAERRNLDRGWLEQQLGQARRVAAVERLIMPPPAGTAKNWAAYRDRFVEPRRISGGVAFWQAHEPWLRQAEERWGVPAQIVVGIIGVETFYGRHLGNFRILDALATLAFDFPPGRKDRSEFFRGELEEFLVLSARERSDPQAALGSFAGAMGLPQFMPGSINRYAIDFDGDGRIDLQGSPADAIGSVAHYLAAFGWRRDQPTHFEVAVPVDLADRSVLLAPDILPSFTPAQFIERGALLPDAARAHDGLLALVMVENGAAAPSYVAGTQNFYAVTRYNWSSYYALAVITLGDAVRRAR